MNNNIIIINKNNSSNNIIQFKKTTNHLKNKYKGYWRVQSLNKIKFNSKEHLLKAKRSNFNNFLKVKSLSPPKKILKNKSTNIINKVNDYYSNDENDFFITKIEINKNFNNNIRIFKTIFKNFPNEPYLYNEINFFSLKTYYKNVKPRTFKEVLNDCKKFKEYECQKFNVNNNKNINIYKRNVLSLPHLNKKSFITNIDKNNNNSNSSNNNISINNNTLLVGNFKNSFFLNNNSKIKNIKNKNIIRNYKIKKINNKFNDSKKINFNFYKSLNSSSSLNKLSTKNYTNNNIF